MTNNTKCKEEKLHKWVWVRRWDFVCENCKLKGVFDDGWISEDEDDEFET